jgi:histone H3/H4
LLKSHYADSTISKDAIHQVQKFVYQFGLHFLVAVKRHLESAKKNTLMMQDMPTCLQRSLSRSSLYQDFSNAMSAALTLYYASYHNGEQPAAEAVDAAAVASVASVEEKRKQMWAARAGLSIPPTRTKEFAKKYLPKFRFSQNSITGLTALFESLAHRIFKLSYEKAQEVNRKRISQLDVQTAVKSDNELSWLLIEPIVPIV